MQILEQIPLGQYTTMRVGGEARFFVSVETEDELVGAVRFAQEKRIPFFVLGEGSNTIFSDNGYPGLIIKNDIRKKSNAEDSWFSVFTRGAGEVWDDFVHEVVSLNLFALENLSGIPGTVGAAPIQNIGAYGVEIKDYILGVRVYDTDRGEFRYMERDECGFSYRDSIFKRQKNLIITEVVFKISKRGRVKLQYKDLEEEIASRKIEALSPSPQDVRESVLAVRARKLPDWKKIPTAGSFFKNPTITFDMYEKLVKKHPSLPGFKEGDMVKVSAAWIIERIAKMKGARLGGVGIYSKHSLVVVNSGEGTAEDIRALSEKIESLVFKKTGIQLEKEVSFIV